MNVFHTTKPIERVRQFGLIKAGYFGHFADAFIHFLAEFTQLRMTIPKRLLGRFLKFWMFKKVQIVNFPFFNFIILLTWILRQPQAVTEGNKSNIQYAVTLRLLVRFLKNLMFWMTQIVYFQFSDFSTLLTWILRQRWPEATDDKPAVQDILSCYSRAH